MQKDRGGGGGGGGRSGSGAQGISPGSNLLEIVCTVLPRLISPLSPPRKYSCRCYPKAINRDSSLFASLITEFDS